MCYGLYLLRLLACSEHKEYQAGCIIETDVPVVHKLFSPNGEEISG
jgi:hypothetical protein